MLTRQDRRFLRQASSYYRHMMVAGAVICVLGAAYTLWGLQQMDPHRAPHPETGFDRPIARLALVIRPRQERLARTQPTTALERTLLNDLARQNDATMRLLLTLIRVLLGSVGITLGFILLSVGLTQWQFLDIAKKLQ